MTCLQINIEPLIFEIKLRLLQTLSHCPRASLPSLPLFDLFPPGCSLLTSLHTSDVYLRPPFVGVLLRTILEDIFILRWRWRAASASPLPPSPSPSSLADSDSSSRSAGLAARAAKGSVLPSPRPPPPPGLCSVPSSSRPGLALQETRTVEGTRLTGQTFSRVYSRNVVRFTFRENFVR